MASKLMKRAVAREATVQALAFDKSPQARKARLDKTTHGQWLNRVQRGEFNVGTKRNGAVKAFVAPAPATKGARVRVAA